MTTVPAEADGPSDGDLIDAVRAGTVAAYGSLYERHVGAARNLARQLARSQAEADDLVSEAFAKVLETLKQGRGPDAAFRAYLLTALRHTAYDKTRRDRKVEYSDDVSQVSGINQDAVSVPFSDTAVAGLERSLAAQAFAKLPERWQAVLWHTEIEGQSPAEVAPLLGLSPNGVSALAYRAREGLKQAYLQVHLAQSDDERCRATADRLGAWVRGGLSKRETAQVEAHLDECERCRALAAELADVNSGLRLFIAPLVLGPLAAAGYLAAAGKAAVGVAAGSAAVAGATAAVAGGAAAGSSGGGAGGVISVLTSVPRQLIGVAASGVALVTAVVIGFAATPSNQEVPAAEVAKPPATTRTQPPRTTTPPTTTPTTPVIVPIEEPPTNSEPDAEEAEEPVPTTTTTAPAPTATTPPATTTPPTTTPPTTTPPTTTPPTTEPPEPARLVAQSPADGVSLRPGTPTDVPITIRNDGGSVSEPVVARLPLPTGVRALPAGGDSTARVASLAPETVRCGGGTGTITCGTGTGLEPGTSTTLVFRLVADDARLTAQTVGSLSAGGETIEFTISIEVVPLTDGVDVRAQVQQQERGRDTRVLASATNTGESTKTVSITFAGRLRQVPTSGEMTCVRERSELTCTSASPLAPGERVAVVATTGRAPDEEDETRALSGGKREVEITAVLGTASDTTSVRLPKKHHPPCCGDHCCKHSGKPDKPTDATKPSSKPEPTSKPLLCVDISIGAGNGDGCRRVMKATPDSRPTPSG
ncbi:sigma-70 family RNA polymerase sigma factor [Actinokineospora auranticolor]|uniref:RNA polymerase sigma factor (Sigma-70 family) n=1 Tax=Actinokineospora auranticolor TaxID=155976 RepID=A0A2S6GX16_9PSEU|nr:sigma-70 family RNA polymerase sigma factor [Actinokineospora auranticolor]PPK69785.1 RNA polymerase sigma factor (sigma-70 family) [Actinokineospora auranticolor]